MILIGFLVLNAFTTVAYLIKEGIILDHFENIINWINKYITFIIMDKKSKDSFAPL